MARLPGPQDTGMGGNLGSWLDSPYGSQFTSGAGSFLSGLFGQGSNPYQSAINQYQQYANRGTNALAPFAAAGAGAIPGYQQWLQSMQNPAQFQNNLMNQYQQSPYAAYLKQQAMRAGQNMGSASGLTGSSPMALQMQQNAGNISSQDMQNWMQNALGINTQYGQGQANLMNTGLWGGEALSNMYGNMANAMGELGYNQGVAQNQDTNNIFGGILGMIPGLSSLFGG